MGFSIAGAGHVAAGMADMEGQLAQNKFRHQLNEQMASQVRQQQEREAFERMARRNIQAPQWNLGNLPQGQMQSQPQIAAPAPSPEQASARNENYGNEGRGKPPAVTGDSDYLSGREQYKKLQSAEQARLDSMRRVAPNGDVVRSTNRMMADMEGRIAGYKQGAQMFDDLATEQAAKKVGAPTSKGNQYAAHFEAAGKKYGVDPQLLMRLAQTESSMNPQAVNRGDGNGGSYGLMQINGQHFNGRMSPEQMMDPATNIDYGARIFADALKRSGGDVTKATQLYKGVKTPEGAARVASAVQHVAGGDQPQQQTAAAPQQEAPAQNLTGQATVMSGQNYDLGMQQLKQQYDYLATAMQNTFDSQQRLQILGHMQQLQQKGQEMQIERVGQAAQFNPEALQQLVSFMAGRVGQPIGVVTDGKGKAQLVRQDGQPIQGQWGQPMPTATLVDGILNNLIPSRAAASSADAAVRSKAVAESTGRAVGDIQVETVKGQYGLAREQMQGLSMAVIAQAKEKAAMGHWGQTVADGLGGFLAARQDGTFVHLPAPVTDKSGKVSTPQPRVITFDQLNAGMIPRG